MKRAAQKVAFPKRANKYKAKTCTYEGGLYHSRREAKYAAELDMLRHAKAKSERVVRWERQIKMPLYVGDRLICNWYIDFKVWYGDGRVELHEVKGFATPEYALKRKLFEALHPDLTLRVIK